MQKFLYRVLAVVVLVSIVALAYLWDLAQSPPAEDVIVATEKVVHIGYTHNPRHVILYRTYINHAFSDVGVKVELVSKPTAQSDFEPVPQNYEDIKTIPSYGQIDDEELLAGLAEKKWDAATVSAATFVQGVAQGLPIVAIAELAHDQKDRPSHAIMFRRNLVIDSPDDIKGTTISNQTTGLLGELFLKEFLAQHGISELDVAINTDEAAGQTFSDGLFAHTLRFMKAAQNAREDASPTEEKSKKKSPPLPDMLMYESMDKWMNPELSHALLVFHKDYIARNPQEVERVVLAYMNEIEKERKLPESVRLLNPGRGFLFGLQMETLIAGLGLPQPDMPPTVSLPLLNELQDLFIKHGYLNSPNKLDAYVDNRFVNSVYEQDFRSGKE